MVISMNRKPRIVVCDFDGCLTCKEDGSYFNINPTKYHASKRIIAYLKSFCIKNDVKILISSNWRKFEPDGLWTNSFGTYKNPLNKLIEDLGELYIGTLPPERHLTKSQCLILWFEDHGSNYDFAIFDDDLREGFQYTSDYGIKDHFILCNPENGITHKNLKDALETIKGKKYND